MKSFYDLHIHSALSPCADDDMTPNNIVNMAALGGLDIIAVTDHNSAKNCRAVCEAGLRAGIIVVPGMELTTAEEIHALCLFPDAGSAEGFGELVRKSLPDIKNRIDIFGRQLILGPDDGQTGEEDILLTNASGIYLWELENALGPWNGICIPAHIDRGSNGLLSVLGGIDRDMGFALAELSAQSDADKYKRRFPFLKFIKNSDAHRLWEISEKETAGAVDGKFMDAEDFIAGLAQIC